MDNKIKNGEIKNSNKFSTKQIVLTGVMAAIVFVSNYISFKIPLIAGAPTRIHIANGFCMIAAMALSPLTGGLAAGIGSMFYDFTNPAYISSAPFTFINKFLMAFVAGKIANIKGKKAENVGFNIMGAAAGQIVYIALYLTKKFIGDVLKGTPVETALVSCGTALISSLVNAVIAVILVVLLLPAFRIAIKKVNRQ